MNTRMHHFLLATTVVGLVSCGGDTENAEVALQSPGDDAGLATLRMRERCDEFETNCLDVQGVRATSEQAEPDAGQPLEPEYAEVSLHTGVFRVGFSIADIFELDEIEGEVLGGVWMPCLSIVMTFAEPDRQELRAEDLTVDAIGAMLGVDFELRTRELASLARDMSGIEREAFFKEQISRCVQEVVE